MQSQTLRCGLNYLPMIQVDLPRLFHRYEHSRSSIGCGEGTRLGRRVQEIVTKSCKGQLRYRKRHCCCSRVQLLTGLPAMCALCAGQLITLSRRSRRSSHCTCVFCRRICRFVVFGRIHAFLRLTTQLGRVCFVLPRSSSSLVASARFRQ